MSQTGSAACVKVSAFAVFMLFFQVVGAQYNFNGLEGKLLQYQKQLGDNAVTLIYKDGKIVYTKEQGDFKANTPAPIASCSKWLTAALVMTFVDEGKLSLDDKVSTYLPIFERYMKNYITVRQCLSHLTGIHDDKGIMAIFKMSRYATLEDEVNDFASKHDIDAQPGKEFRYSSIGLNIAGRICEIVGKKSFEQLMQQRLFKPLAMKNTTFQRDFGKAANPSGGAISTANDYMNFLVMILNKGMYNGKQILSEAAINQMEQAQTTPDLIKYAPAAAEGFNYGFGEWLLEQDASGKGICVSSPGLFGTWPMVDNCRGYASIVFVKTLLSSEQKKDVYMDIKSSIDSIFPCTK